MGLFDMFRRERENRGGRYLDISNSHTTKVMQVKKTIEDNADKLKHLILLAQKYPELEDILQDIYVDIKYANPVVSNEIKEIDEKISNKLDDMKLMLSRSIKSNLAMEHAIRDLKELVHLRETKE